VEDETKPGHGVSGFGRDSVVVRIPQGLASRISLLVGSFALAPFGKELLNGLERPFHIVNGTVQFGESLAE